MPIPPRTKIIESFESILSDGKPHALQDIYRRLAVEFNLSDTERWETYPGKAEVRFEKEVRFAGQKLKDDRQAFRPALGVYQIKR